jgi:hypothetical protein
MHRPTKSWRSLLSIRMIAPIHRVLRHNHRQSPLPLPAHTHTRERAHTSPTRALDLVTRVHTQMCTRILRDTLRCG